MIGNGFAFVWGLLILFSAAAIGTFWVGPWLWKKICGITEILSRMGSFSKKRLGQVWKDRMQQINTKTT